MSLKTYTHGPFSGGKPKSMVILLHGLGANGLDLLGLSRYWERLLPDTIFISPDAPFPCDMAPVGFQWFSLQSRTQESRIEGVQKAEPILQQYIDGLLQQYDIPDERLVLLGFSQGTMMSLYAGPRRKKPIAGILGYSGMLVAGDAVTDTGLHKVPVHLIHGDVDMVLPVSLYHEAHKSLTEQGFTVTGSVTRGLGHSIDEDGIEEGGAFLAQCLSS